MKKDSSPQSASGAGKPQTRSLGTNTSPCQPRPRPAGRYTSAIVTASNIIIVLLVLSTLLPHTSLDRLYILSAAAIFASSVHSWQVFYDPSAELYSLILLFFSGPLSVLLPFTIWAEWERLAK
ncbi:hypothetical protein QBC33DRAFT_541818 [Phialemonium atrogriseum]|uniref:Uncharacterized protein n=1 Tax=Phialemonium atrogriseum TaxID=1093897 RepID=A0AAJ0BZ51_9PEZI|nr:uncharacterized protein QBC33DRAFT_541818 [Phialemonium atrogriseum]KAK1766098.1 hypothetical protein QBC33DRAFT_541818 [Phialemonium atrogriseum]